MILFILEFYNQPKLYPNATWIQKGTVYPYTDEKLYCPRSIFVDMNDTVYVSFDKKGIVIVWSKGNNTPSRIYNGDNSVTSLSSIFDALSIIYQLFQAAIWVIPNFWDLFWKYKDKLDVSNSLFVTSNGDIYVGNDYRNRIDVWSRNSMYNEIRLSAGEPCYGLFVDSNNVIYCSLKDKHKVIKNSITDKNTWTLRAGDTYSGSNKSPDLDGPFGIFVDINFKLYVADYNQNRIQLFESEQTTGMVVVENTLEFNNRKLSGPTSIALDADNNLYIVDSHNHRVVLFALNPRQHRCVVGCSSNAGSESDSMKIPTAISFDSSGNILVSDTYNNRVLKFQLKTNFYGKFHKYPIHQIVLRFWFSLYDNTRSFIQIRIYILFQ